MPEPIWKEIENYASVRPGVRLWECYLGKEVWAEVALREADGMVFARQYDDAWDDEAWGAGDEMELLPYPGFTVEQVQQILSVQLTLNRPEDD